MFAQSYFELAVVHNILHHFFVWIFYHFPYLPILEVDMALITKYEYDKYFSIATWGKQGGSCEK